MLANLLSAIEAAFPLPGRFRSRLPADVAELSRLLTSARSERDGGYLNQPAMRSAYLRYFLPWNVFRLCKLFLFTGPQGQTIAQPSADKLPFADGDVITDLGSGPLVLPIALWIAFPHLRRIKLEFRCVDKSAAALEAGHTLFKALAAISGGGSSGSGLPAANTSAWKIQTIKHDIRSFTEKPPPATCLPPGKASALVTALNVFNETPWFMHRPPHASSGAHLQKAAALLSAHCAANGAILVMEPGNPKGGAFIAALRAALLAQGRPPLAPCPHAGPCPLAVDKQPPRGTKAKWCHFAFDTEDAPAALHKLSAAAGIPKERAVFSFLAAGRLFDAPTKPDNAANARIRRNAAGYLLAAAPSRSTSVHVRIISDTFPVLAGAENPRQASSRRQIGCYGCCELGMVLVTAGGRSADNLLAAGDLLELPLPAHPQRDAKTGALIIPLV